MRKTTIYKKAVKKWGYPLQLGMLMEECAELIQATNKVMRYSNTEKEREKIHNLANEIADVEIMIGQLKTMYDWYRLKEKIEEYKHSKLIKLERMVFEEGDSKK